MSWEIRKITENPITQKKVIAIKTADIILNTATISTYLSVILGHPVAVNFDKLINHCFDFVN